ncbi:family 10 glycosylhydrolase [Fodinibius sp. Rm-B-1B1-1]|uniref:family 10 glycosylhydrolase n=1 Tax=Fodinibius alkaliphilus TaxID=3140241 RepID=UPI003159CADC
MDRKHFLKKTGMGMAGFFGGFGITKPLSIRGKSDHYQSKNWVWITESEGTVDEWKSRLEHLKKAGFDAILPQENFDNIIPAAEALDIEVHAWLVSLQRGSDKKVQKEHPEWFMVNRNGESSLEKPAYVDYYKWLCPSRKPVHEYLKEQAQELLQYSEIQSIHLDYIRYPDVILPIDLQPKYDIVQDKEYPQYDYCYCSVCRQKFEEKYGSDPMEIEDPAHHEKWLQFRYDRVTTLVNKLAIMVHEENRELTAAVFPTPDIARNLVRQNWPDWDLDAVLPMMYQNFYDKGIDWIGQAVKECRQELPKTTRLYSGLFVPSLNEEEIAQAFEHAMGAGADGISLFTDTEMEKPDWKNLRRVIRRG